MREYQLIIRVPFEALDDADARVKAKELLVAYDNPDNVVTKLQRLRERQEPEGVKL